MIQNELKKAVGIKSVELIQPHTTVGLGTGSTVYYMIEELGQRIQKENLAVECVTTSNRTWKHAEKLGIPLKKLDEVHKIDLTIDGADEIDQNYQGIKGGGGAHTREKIVALNSRQNIWIVDQSKMVSHLGKFPLPLEVNSFGSQQLFERLQAENLHPVFRVDDQGNKSLTHMKNYIIDLHLKEINHPHLLADWLDHQSGIIEHGLFLDVVNTVIIGSDNGVKIIDHIR